MVLTVLKNKFFKQNPKEVEYRCYRNVDRGVFRHELSTLLAEAHTLENFAEFYLRVLDKHAPVKWKTVRINQAQYMTKPLRKAIMRRSALQAIFYKDKTQFMKECTKTKRTLVVGFTKGKGEKFIIT